MKKSSFNASHLLSAHSVTPLAGAPAWTDLEFKSLPATAARIGGSGLYCVSYRGRAIYIGKFLGTESNPFGGDLQKIRWERHIPSLTMRGQKVSLGKRVLAKLRKESHASSLAAGLGQADPATLAHYRGYHASYNRVKFAATHWAQLQKDPTDFLRDFEFGYVQFEPAELAGWAHTAIWQLVSNAEALARQKLHLCCNGESDFEASLAEQPLSLPQVLERLHADMEKLRAEESGRITAVPAAASAAPAARRGKGQETSQQAEPAEPRRTALPLHLKSDAAMERLEESLPTGWRTEWLERLRLTIQDEALEVHATATGKYGDVRVRALDLKRQRNVFTMAWRPSDGRFSCRILLGEDQVAACPGVQMLASSLTDPLKTGFIFDAGQAHEPAIEGLLRLISQAHQHAQEAGL